LRVLAVNSGSSSLKHLLAEGKVEAGSGRHPVQDLMADLRQRGLLDGLEAVGHRVVHGGDRFVDPVAVDERVLADLDALSELAPLHNPPAVAGIREALAALPGEPEVAVFDTAFHARMPPTGALYAVPRDWGVRRYGFHGLAHRWLAERYAELSGRPLAELRLITLQLGSGCSAAAIAGGHSIDTSMGLTPTEGLVMSTRSGDVDPTLVQFLSGSADMRQLLRATGAQAREAIEVFTYRARKYVGAYMAALGGLDAVVFGGGVGEAAPDIRRRILDGMEWLGIELDAARNQARTSGEGVISAAGSAVAVHVIPDDEQALICRDTAALVRKR